jgi:hypothetical protein
MEERMTYKNQYYVTNLELTNPKELKKISFNNLNVYFHPSLKVSSAQKDSTEILLLGYIINPFQPQETNDDIVKNIADTCNSKETLFKELQNLSGRYVLLYKNKSDFIALNDSDALKQLYYGFIDNDIILTSSPKMFLDFYGGDLQISDMKRVFINLKEYEPNEHAWFGDKCIDDRLMKVLPNHFLDIINKQVYRAPISFDKLVNEHDIVEYASALLKGSMAAITKRYKVIQPITAGWDSRTLLAASRDCLKDIQFYVIDFSTDNNLLPDVWIPQKLSEKLGLNFQVIKLKEPSDEFITRFKREHVVPRLQYLAELEYLYNIYANSNAVRVSGIAGATLKAVYGYTNYNIDANELHHFTYYSGKSVFIKNEISYWMNDAKEYTKEYGIPLLDLFHWENKVGNWGALTVFEQDIAIEDFCPHANRNLLASILRINPEKRTKPECLLIGSIVKNLWEDTLSEPVNPVGLVKDIRRRLKKHAMLKYYKLRILSALSHLELPLIDRGVAPN